MHVRSCSGYLEYTRFVLSRWPYTRPTPPVAKTVARAQVPAVKYHRVDVGLPWGTVWMSCGYRTDKFWMYGGCTADDRTDDVRMTYGYRRDVIGIS